MEGRIMETNYTFVINRNGEIIFKSEGEEVENK